MINQIKAEGDIDIKTSLLTGHIKSGSAGLFICFLAIIFILISLLSNDFEVLKQLRNNSILTLVLLLLFLFILIGVAIYVPSVRYLVNVLVGIMVFPITVVIRSITK